MTYDIMVDIDEVIAPTVDSIHTLAHAQGVHDGSRPMETYYGYEQYGITEEAYWALWSDFALSGGYLTMDPIPGSLEGLRRLVWEGHRIHLVTARGFMQHSQEIKDWTEEWLFEHAVPHTTLSFAKDKVAIQKDLRVRFDYAIDDRMPTVAALRADGVQAFLMHHTHNLLDRVDVRYCVDNMAEFVGHIIKEDARV